MKSEITTLRKKNQTFSTLTVELETLRDDKCNLESTITTLNSTVSSLQSALEIQKSDFAAVNKTMDERLAAMLSKMVKERSRSVVGKRDEQWREDVGRLRNEKEFMGKVLMREWGRQECGVAEEDKENQVYGYKYVQRS